MKTSTYLLILTAFVFFGCSDTVEFNDPAMQANFEGETWKADFFAADIDFGGFLVEGQRGGEVLQLITQTDTRGVFALGPETPSYAVFRDAQGIVYSTRNLPDESVTIYPGEGEIEVVDIDNSDPKRIRGTFRFTAYSEDGLQSVNFISGVFHQISLFGGLEAIPD